MIHTAYDEGQRLRLRQRAADAIASQNPGTVTRGAPCMVAATKTLTTYPTTAATYYACDVVAVTGAETEGGAGILTVVSPTTFFALNIGTAIPPTGTKIIVTFVDYRWSFRYDG